VREKAREELAQFYPPDEDGSVPVAYLWSRTVPCPNCAAEMPLIRQYWLAQRAGRKTAIRPALDRESKRVMFEVIRGDAIVDEEQTAATTSSGDAVCLFCRQVSKGSYLRQAGRNGSLRAVLTAVVLSPASGTEGKIYRTARPSDLTVVEEASIVVSRGTEIYGRAESNRRRLPCVDALDSTHGHLVQLATAAYTSVFSRLAAPRLSRCAIRSRPEYSQQSDSI